MHVSTITEVFVKKNSKAFVETLSKRHSFTEDLDPHAQQGLIIICHSCKQVNSLAVNSAFSRDNYFRNYRDKKRY